MSYTTFGYSNLTVSAVSPSGQVQIGFDLKNTGNLTGAEVPQLYLGFPLAAGEPPKLLKGFQRISLSPGQTRHVTFNLDWQDLANWDTTARGWIVTPGGFQVMVGASSRDLRLTGAFTVASVPSSDLANAALQQPVTVSFALSINTPGSAAVDGDLTTAWTSLAADPQWIAVDLSVTRDLSRVRLSWNTNFASSYAIQISPDGTNWTGIFSTNNDVGGIEDILVSGRGRYVRINGTAQGSPGNGYSLSELEVYSQPQRPFGGVVPTLSGRIEAENYDTGGEGVAYYNTTVGNPGGVYRSDDVGIEPTSDTGGGYDVSWLNTGEWLEYTVNPPDPTAKCSISLRVAAPAAGGQLRVRLNGTVLGTVAIPNTGGSQIWQTVTMPAVSVAGGIGSQALRLEVITNGFSINWIGLNVTQSGTNIALYKAATASSLENSGSPATNAFDGNLGTRWSSAWSDPQWIQVDLGATYNILEVVLYWETAYGKSYQIQVSSNATSWTTIYSTTTGFGGTEDLTGLSGTGRYVRMYGTARGTQWGYSLWEFQIYGTPVLTNQPPVLAAIPNQSILAGRTLLVTNSASDPNTPPLPLTFSLLTAPTNAAINASNGVFSWRPAIAQSPSTQTVAVVVSDNGSPILSATQSFTATVTPPAVPTLSAESITSGQFGFWIYGDSGPDYTILASTNLTSWNAIFTTNSPLLPCFWVDTNSAAYPLRFYRTVLGP